MSGMFDDAIAFFTALEADNTPEFWARERHRYDGSIRPTFLALLDALTSPPNGWRVYRARNDTRFGKTEPYKTFIGAVSERADGVGTFVQVSAKGLLVGTGIPMPAPDQLTALRAAIADDRTGPGFAAAVAATTAAGAVVHGGRWPPLQRAPRGYPADHPRAEHLRWKGVETNQRVRRPDWRSVEAAAGAIDDMITAPADLHGWLGTHVGPSALSPEERFAPKRR